LGIRHSAAARQNRDNHPATKKAPHISLPPAFPASQGLADAGTSLSTTIPPGPPGTTMMLTVDSECLFPSEQFCTVLNSVQTTIFEMAQWQ
jgi:hypothetical protein